MFCDQLGVTRDRKQSGQKSAMGRGWLATDIGSLISDHRFRVTGFWSEGADDEPPSGLLSVAAAPSRRFRGRVRTADRVLLRRAVRVSDAGRTRLDFPQFAVAVARYR